MSANETNTPGGLSPRLEIASRVLAGHVGWSDADVCSALALANALLAADAATRKEDPQDVAQLRADLARVTRERDEAIKLWQDTQPVLGNLITRLSDTTIERDRLAAALAPLPEEKGLEPLNATQFCWVQALQASVAWQPLARHALANNARMLRRKQEGKGA